MAAEEYVSRNEFEQLRGDVRSIWTKIGTMQESMAKLSNDVAEIKVLLTERCRSRERAVDTAITAIERNCAAYQHTHATQHQRCQTEQDEMEARIASLERTRIWMLGASAAIGAFVGVGVQALPVFEKMFGG